MINRRKNRIDALIEKGIKKQVILIEAAPGYGKSVLVRQFLKEYSFDYSWLRLRQMDNWLFFNWKQLIKSLVRIMPTSQKFLQLEVPTTVGQIAELIELIEQFGNKKRVLVIDDYSILQNKHIQFLYESLIEADFSSLTLIIISSRKTNLPTICKQSNVDFFYIGDQELRFTLEETRQLFKENSCELSDEQLNRIDNRWHGWPLPLTTIVDDSLSVEKILSSPNPLRPIKELFYTQFYENYPKRIRSTLIKLSLLDKIPREIFSALELSDFEKEVILHNPFIFQEFESNSVALHNAYNEFLNEQKHSLAEEERREFLKISAEIFSQRGQLEEALPLSLQCKEYDLAIKLVWEMISLFTDYSKAQFLYHHMAEVPSDYFVHHPNAELLRIYLLCLLNETERAELALNDLIAQIKLMEKPDTEILGEAHFLLSQFARLTGKADHLENLRLACSYLPKGSQYWGQPIPVILRAPWVRLPRYVKGATDQLEQTKQLFKKANPYYTKIYGGENIHIDKVSAAEIDYYHHDLEAARVKFLELLYLNDFEEAHEGQMLIRYYLVKIALFQGNVVEAKKQAKVIYDLIHKFELYQYNGFYARLTSLIHLCLNDLKEMPTRIVINSLEQSSKWEVTRNGITQSRYLIQIEKFEESLALLNYLEQAYRAYEGHWLNTVYVRLLRAITYFKRGETTEAASDMLVVYEMTYGNNIITPYIEYGRDTCNLIELIRKEYPDQVDFAWLDVIYTKANSFSRRVKQLRRQRTIERNPVQLTARRREILRDIVDGLSVNEIAEKREISKNTVKTHVKNIYSDLGAMNRSDAVRIAIKGGIV
ncbi:LuxR C-terminal-related transcriptional regulator [Enterococcus sp. DIV0756]|uniref:helix-turn-helix transcriptional regulator n=1 Tax=Enterococcus sp. DIV0756 TaxID=2774636 RepID=UPI003F28844F